jgi:hypothetical protein
VKSCCGGAAWWWRGVESSERGTFLRKVSFVREISIERGQKLEQTSVRVVKEVLSYGKFRSFEKILAKTAENSNKRQFPQRSLILMDMQIIRDS